MFLLAAYILLSQFHYNSFFFFELFWDLEPSASIKRKEANRRIGQTKYSTLAPLPESIL
jgi:hypothetical protein